MATNEKTISSGEFKASICEQSNKIDFINFEIYDSEVELNCMEIVSEIENLKTDFSFRLKIEQAYLLKDFLNYALTEK